MCIRFSLYCSLNWFVSGNNGDKHGERDKNCSPCLYFGVLKGKTEIMFYKENIWLVLSAVVYIY